MFAKKSFNPSTIRVFSFILAGIVLIGINVLLSGFAMNKVYRYTENKFLENYSLNSDGYAKSVEQILSKYISLLDYFDSDYISSSSEKDIQNYLVSLYKKIPKDISSFAYTNLEGIVYLCNGVVFKTPKIDSFKKLIQNNSEFFISDPYISYMSGRTEIGFGKIVYDKNGSKKGCLNASISLDTLHELFSSLWIGNSQNFSIRAGNGMEIFNLNKTILDSHSVFFKPALIREEYNAFNVLVRGIVQSKTQDGENVLIFFNRIENTEWYLGLSVMENEYNGILRRHRFYQSFIVICSIISVMLILFLELRLTEYLRKKDLLASDYDQLTQLFTRPHFEQDAAKILRRNKNSKFMLVEADIHGFKFINQNFGIETGDKLLSYFARLLSNHVEKSKGIICRGYADHFYYIMKVESVHKAMKEFKDHLAFINECIKNYEIQFFPKFGITFYIPQAEGLPEKSVTVQELIGQASFAKGTIKENILDSYAIYDSHLLKKSNRDHYIESHMKQALAEHEFFVMYQPKVDLKTDKVIGAEALVRWNSSKFGLLQPNKFIPLFEKNDFVKELDFYVYEEVFKFIRNCLDNNVPVVPISVNMSRNHSKPEAFMRRFKAIFDKYDIPPNLIEIEILERSVMDRQTLRDTTIMLHDSGFKVAMDDFGSGESSLNMLTNIPVDVLKFDKSFLDSAKKEDNSLDENATGLISSLINLGKQLNIQTLFEGVETEQQKNFLKDADCDYVQGFLYSKPLTEFEYVTFVRHHT